ncbi:VQ motif-containing protein [Striga asiatica]|uniref:VQ motif-containing protein n=1 Tax=Striga asiatica TaxID=4170 RepID=A0A5A7Q460_STRAF|nr:VQ motif-containing protein [Striga asiatica]
MHKNPHTTPKPKSKIRIIHIFAPQVIKTDAANFRELVQRLTGKPSDEEKVAKKPKVLVEPEPKNENINMLCSNEKMEMMAGFHVGGEGFREKIKGEEEIWRDANTGGGFLEFDDDDDDVIGGHHGFLKEISNVDQFPFIEGTTQDECF